MRPIWLAVSRAPQRQPHSIRRPGGRARLGFENILRRSNIAFGIALGLLRARNVGLVSERKCDQLIILATAATFQLLKVCRKLEFSACLCAKPSRLGIAQG